MSLHHRVVKESSWDIWGTQGVIHYKPVHASFSSSTGFCGRKEIPHDRLTNSPEATTCKRCLQQLAKQTEKQRTKKAGADQQQRVDEMSWLIPKTPKPEEKKARREWAEGVLAGIEQLVARHGRTERMGLALVLTAPQSKPGRGMWAVAEPNYHTKKVLVRNHLDVKKSLAPNPKRVAQAMIDMSGA